jgi:hypothetical protein
VRTALVAEDPFRCAGGMGLGNGVHEVNLLFPRVQLNVIRILRAKIGKK